MHKAKPAVRIHTDALARNWSALARMAGCETLAVVKSDAYGHGLKESVEALAGAGATSMAVGGLDEVADLRHAGWRGPAVSLLGPIDEQEAKDMVALDAICFVGRLEQLAWLGKAGADQDKAVAVALKFNTGMSRLGFPGRDVSSVLAALQAAPGVRAVLAASHLSSADADPGADPEGSAVTEGQMRQVKGIVEALRAAGHPVRACLCNSAGILSGVCQTLNQAFGPDNNAVRPGIAMYGANPFHGGEREHLGAFLEPTMAVSARVLAVRDVVAGDTVSYGRTYTAEHDMRLAVIAAGYADGYSRLLSNSGSVCLHGRRAPIRGRVCMQMTLVDVTHIPEAAPGDDAWLLGGDGDGAVSIHDLAAWWGTITYEPFCVLGRLNPRVYT